ncbi:MAG: hypothetical protein EXR38_06010 [Methylotenera sp.]|nr:hypothetical protein [Methylotenera sp.]MSQ00032.1 hypothetical protein [Methylotenera sp.]
MLIIRALIASLCLLMSATGHADEAYSVLYVYDGDTVKLRPSKATNAQSDFKLRFTAIDAQNASKTTG